MSNKLARWKVQAHNGMSVQLAGGYDVSMSPAAPRASFPYDMLPPMQLLSTADILGKLVRVDDIATTAVQSFLFGFFTFLGMRAVSGESQLQLVFGRGRRLHRLVVLIGCVIVFARQILMRRCTPAVVDVNQKLNVSSDPGGPCNVVCRTLVLSNSHAGTHADTPRHFLPDSMPVTDWDDQHYTGDALVVDLSPFLKMSGSKAITGEVLHNAGQALHIDWGSVWRLLLCTRTLDADATDNSQWVGDFAHFSADGAAFLATQCTQLLLVGVDSPSVDHPSVAPICDHSHGALWDAQIAVLENLDFQRLFPVLAARGGALVGAALTVWSPMQRFEDSKGCTVIFYPRDN
jgi:kynurenine formamidase